MKRTGLNGVLIPGYFCICSLLFSSLAIGQPYTGQVANIDHSKMAITQSGIDSGWSKLTAPVYGISEDTSAVNAWGESSAKFIAWCELRNRQYRDKGVGFFEKFPDDPRFKAWFLKTTLESPDYWKNPEKDALNQANYIAKGSALTPEIDEEAEKEWVPHYLVFRSRYLADPAVSMEDKTNFRRQELQLNINRLSKRIELSTGNLDANLAASMPLLNSYCTQAFDMAEGPNGDIGALQMILNVFGSHDRELEHRLISYFKQSKDSNVRNDASTKEMLLSRWRDNPAQLKLPALDGSGKVIDLEKLRGKVVLLDFWDVGCHGCILHMPKYERIYKEFHDKGFEVFGICITGIACPEGSDPKVLVELDRKRALELEKRQGVTYLSALFTPGMKADRTPNYDNPVWKYFDDAYGGQVFLLDQQGRLITTDQQGQWLEFEVRKLLGLPLDKTGK